MNARNNLLALALVSLTLIGVGGSAFFLHLQNTAVTEARRNSDRTASLLGDQISLYFDRQRRVSHAISGSPLFSRAFTLPSRESLDAVNALLDHNCETLAAAVCYLMDPQGMTVASSNRDTSTSFVGKNYAFRPYFQKALAGKPAVYLALGVTSKKRGIYFSSPILTKKGTVEGVLVIKAPVEDLEEHLEDYPGIAALIDAKGIVFASNREDWLFQGIRPLSEEEAEEISKTRQYGSSKPRWLGVREISGGRATHPDGHTYLIAYKNLVQPSDWQVVYLFDVAGISIFDPVNPLGNTIVFGFGAIFLITGLVVVFLYRTGTRDLRRRLEAEEALRNSSLQLKNQSTALLGLVRQSNPAGTELNRALEEITKAASETLNVGRCSIWKFDKAHTKITCICLYEKNQQSHSYGVVLEAKDYPSYFRSLNEERSIAAEDAHTDPRTKEFSESYLSPLGITSMMDSPIWLDGVLAGIVCHEHLGKMRKWTLEEQSFAGSIANLAAFAMEAAERRKLEDQIRQSQKLEAVGQLAGGIAHEFNNMLQVIMNSANFAHIHLHEPAKAEEYLGTILKSVERSSNLTKQLLAYGRKTTLVPTTLNLNETISSLMKMVRPIIGEDIELEFKQGEEIFPVKADPRLLEQILINLCVNARDAMPDGGRLTFETSNYHAEQEFRDLHGWRKAVNYAMISVSDNGIGMTSEIREHIFEPFFTTKEVGQGTGLGLAMVHGIVQQHDGEIEVFSEPQVGTTFNIYLPKADLQEPRTEVPVVGDSPGGSETILVAEDEEDVLNMLSETLESRGYQVLSARNGEEAMSVFKANVDRIDLVILDMVMPKPRGRKVYEQIREVGSDVPVVFSTGYSLETSDVEFVSEKGLCTLHKPYAPNELLATVRDVLDQR